LRVHCAGSEWDYVVLSTVRSVDVQSIEAATSRHRTEKWRKQNLGIITDRHQINVAITRARKGLVIIG